MAHGLYEDVLMLSRAKACLDVTLSFDGTLESQMVVFEFSVDDRGNALINNAVGNNHSFLVSRVEYRLVVR